MEQRHLGSAGIVVSRLTLGTMTWGRDTDEHEARDQLVAFVGAGGTLVDTADVYGDGAAERTLGTLLGDVVDRDQVLLATKAVSRPGTDRHFDASRGHLLAALDGSLRRLGTDYVDLWQLHAPDPLTPMDETLAAMDDAVRTGRVRYLGISNFSGWQTAQFATWQRAIPGQSPLVSTQMEYSLLQRGVEREVLPAGRALGLGLLAWSPLGRGVLTGKYRRTIPADSRAASPHLAGFVEPYLARTSATVVEAVATAAEGLERTPLEVSLAWVLSRGIASAIVGARTAAQLRASLTAEAVVLPDEVRRALTEISAPALGYPERF